MLSLGLFSFLMFSTTNFLVLYISYEASLLPIIYCIFKWGVYPERTLRALIILLFTRFFTFPLIIILLLTSNFRFSLIPRISPLFLRLGGSL
jgi:NADH:ubiquinone oxidoreductase subunit 4 (subunit M)